MKAWIIEKMVDGLCGNKVPVYYDFHACKWTIYPVVIFEKPESPRWNFPEDQIIEIEISKVEKGHEGA